MMYVLLWMDFCRIHSFGVHGLETLLGILFGA